MELVLLITGEVLEGGLREGAVLGVVEQTRGTRMGGRTGFSTF